MDEGRCSRDAGRCTHTDCTGNGDRQAQMAVIELWTLFGGPGGCGRSGGPGRGLGPIVNE